jgi:hypothetical protein
MRLGVYVEDFNLYYQARGLCGRGAPDWRWLDIRALAQRVVSRLPHWHGARIARVAYCTAVIDACALGRPAAPQQPAVGAAAATLGALSDAAGAR